MNELGSLVMAQMDMIQEPGHVLREKISEEGLEELSKSLGKVGLENPIKLRKRENGYEIVSGHRRFLAARMLGWTEIKAIVEVVDDETTRLRAIHENFHREDMSPIEEGRACKSLLDEHGYSIKDVARLCSKSASWVLSRLDLLDMPVELREAVDVGALSVSAARELAGITDDAARAYYVEYAIKQGATAQLCAFWRGRWEIEKTVNDPRNVQGADPYGSAPPLVVTLACNWCAQDIAIHLLNHVRLCPKCTEWFFQAQRIAEQEAREAARGGGDGSVVVG